jgi:hypothetical protein
MGARIVSESGLRGRKERRCGYRCKERDRECLHGGLPEALNHTTLCSVTGKFH